MTPDQLKTLVRAVPDFPEPGILFRDITTLISHGEGFAHCVRHLADRAAASGASLVAGMEGATGSKSIPGRLPPASAW